MAARDPGGSCSGADDGDGRPPAPSRTARPVSDRKRRRDAEPDGGNSTGPTPLCSGHDVIVIADEEADAHATDVVATTPSVQTGGRAESAGRSTSKSPVAGLPTIDLATETSRSGAHERSAAGLPSASTPAGSTAGDAGGNVGTHLQTAADLLAASFLVSTAGIVLPPVSGMPLAKAPLELTYPMPPSSSSQLAAEVYLVVDDRETTGVGPSRAAFLARLTVNPGLADRVVRRRLPVGDALLVARVTATGAAAYEGAPPEGTEILLDQLMERKTAEDVVASLRDGRLHEQTYFMAASGRSSLTCIVEGDLDGATQNDADMREAAKNFLAALSVASSFFVKYTDGLDETAAYFASLVRHRCRRLGTVSGLAGWLSAHRATDGAVPGADGVLTYSLWEEEMTKMRQTTTLQQMWALQLLVVPGIGKARVNTIIQGSFKVPTALAEAYGATSTAEEGKALLAQLTPPPGCAGIPMPVSTYMYDFFMAQEYGGSAP